LGLSFGDRACLALAKSLVAPALTADRSWARLDLGIAIEVIR
jgi:ribonuclease VapC